jgi:ABC-type multidrug transport system ATPase subunit
VFRLSSLSSPLKAREPEGGDVVPDTGDVKIKGISVVDSPRSARLALGVCPQFTAIDTQLTVREHLLIYGRLKGLTRGPELNANIKSLMDATSLNMYADRLASQLSGGNQRKLSLAIALIGESRPFVHVYCALANASPCRQSLCRAYR